MIPKKRAILNEVLSRTPDKPLYHYTTQKGLLGIIKNREIWATHTQYLNDRREFLHAVDLVREEIKKLLDQETSNGSRQPVREQVLLRMQQSVSMSPEGINVCVCSFSEESDSLSQWRAYGGSSGFAIGFSGEVLKAATENLQWFLAPWDGAKEGDVWVYLESFLVHYRNLIDFFGKKTSRNRNKKRDKSAFVANFCI
jgi:hypothetical protein